MAARNSFDQDGVDDYTSSVGASRATLVLWLIVIGLAAFFLPLNLIAASVHEDTVRLRANLQPIEATLAVVNTPAPEIQTLQAEISQARQSEQTIEAAYSSLTADRINWPAVMAAIGNYNPAQLTLSSLTQADNQITLNGRAADESTVVSYARQLEESDVFSRVVIQSVRAVGTPFASPTVPAEGPGDATALPTDGTTTPAADTADSYETDDFEYTPIIQGQAQRHNFFPIFDVDKVKFLAKAGRYYRVYTFDLAPGVDTFMTVGVGGTLYINDDRELGELASEVLFQVGRTQDVEALVTLTNRGQYGPGMWYQVAVEEVVPTPTPVPSATPLPTSTSVPTVTPVPTNTPIPSSTPVPTNTPVPPNTPTATTDLRDPYEPDDTARPLAVGEVQPHNFYPAGDVDRVNFLAKAGRRYLVSTSELALGVDTFLEVSKDGMRWENDDYDLPGSGNFASAVCFDAPSEGPVDVVVSNRSQQYGPDKRYNISVIEAPMLSANPLALDFGSVVEGGANPATQQINITHVGEEPIDWEVATDAAWLTLSPAAGTTPSLVQVAANTAGLAPGQYQGNIVIRSTSLCAANVPLTVSVSLEVVPAAARVPGLASILVRQPSLQGQAYEFVIVLEVATP